MKEEFRVVDLVSLDARREIEDALNGGFYHSGSFGDRFLVLAHPKQEEAR